MPKWTSKVVLVTGAGQTCGRAIAEDFAGRGASVVVNDINAEGGLQTVHRIDAAVHTYGPSTSPSTTRAPSCQ